MIELLEQWLGTSPKWESRFEYDVIRRFTNYGSGANEAQLNQGKIFGAGYEIYILAFFIGLYRNETRPLREEVEITKSFGVPLRDWKGSDRLLRKPYPELLEYIFAALVSRTDIDMLALDKGKTALSTVAGQLRKKMEEYANVGLRVLDETLKDYPNRLLSDHGFLQLFQAFVAPSVPEEEEDEPPLV